ncbi:MAG: hypothetical protein QG632_706 [Candidatus Dependentiae bacterium]|nr:hypothetical protein [Candidatus Dependentiae bacterium]
MKKMLLHGFLLMVSIDVGAMPTKKLFVKTEKDWSEKKIKGTHLARTSFYINEQGHLRSTVRHKEYTPGALFDIALKVTNDSLAHAQDWNTEVYSVTMIDAGTKKHKKEKFSRAQLYTAIIATLKEQEGREQSYPVTTMIQGLERFQSFITQHPQRVSELAEKLSIKKGSPRQGCLEVLSGLASPALPAEPQQALTNDSVAVVAPREVQVVVTPAPTPQSALENGAAVTQSAPVVEMQDASYITMKQAALILSGTLVVIIGADYAKRGPDSVLARAWTKGKKCARNVMQCLFGSANS